MPGWYVIISLTITLTQHGDIFLYSFNAINGSSIQERNCFIYFLKCRQKQVILNCSNLPCQYIVEEKPFLHTFLCIKHIFTPLKREFYGRQLCEVQLIRETYSDTIYQNKSLWPLVLGRISQERQFSRGQLSRGSLFREICPGRWGKSTEEFHRERLFVM